MWSTAEWTMAEHTAKNLCPFKQKTLDFYLKLLLLLKNVMHHQSLMQHCPIKTAGDGFLNFTSNMGSPFYFKLPLPVTAENLQHCQISLADGENTLPHWMVFKRHSCSIAGLALTEDCGIYHLKASVAGETYAAYFYLHILNKTATDIDPARSIMSCSEGRMVIWANLVLHLNPLPLSGSQRLHLVSTVADYLQLPVCLVYLFSRRKSFLQQQKKLRVCKRGGLTEKLNASGDVTDLLWPVSCEGEEPQSDLAETLKHVMKTGVLVRFLQAPVLEWRIFCTPGDMQSKVKRDLQRPTFTPTSSPDNVNQTAKDDDDDVPLSLLTLLLREKLEGPKLEPTHTKDSTDSAGNSLNKHLLLQASDAHPVSPEKTFKFLSGGHTLKTLGINQEKAVIILKTGHLQNTWVPSHFLLSLEHTHSNDVNSVLKGQVLTALYSSACVAFVCSHSNLFSVSHNFQENMKQTEFSASKIKPLTQTTTSEASEVTSAVLLLSISEYLWTTELFSSALLPGHVVSEPSAEITLPTLLPSSTPHSIYPPLLLTPASYSVTSTLTHEAVDRESHTTRLTPRPHLKETSLWTEHYGASRTDSESQPTVSSQSSMIFSQEPVKDANSSRPSVSHPPLPQNYNDILLLSSSFEPVQSPLPSNEIPSTQHFPDVSPTSYLMIHQLSITQQTETSLKHLSSAPTGQNEDVMSRPNVTTQDVSSTILTAQFTKSGLTQLESSLSMSLFGPTMTTFTPALPPKHELFTEQLETSLSFSLEFLKDSSSVISLLQTFPSFSSLQTDSFFLNLESKVFTESKSATGVNFDQNETQTLISDILQTSLLSLMSHHTDNYSHSSLVPGLTTSMNFNLTVLTTFKQGPSATLLSLPMSTRPVSKSHFDPTAPSAAQDPSTASSVHLTQSLEPSFPLCGQSVAKDHLYVSGCSTLIKSIYTENIIEDVLAFFTSYPQDEKSLLFTSSSTSSSSRSSSFSIITFTSLQSVGLFSDRRRSSVQSLHSSASSSYSLNLPPTLLQSIPVLMATVGFPFLYSIPPETFLDPEDGEADTLSLEIRFIDVPPVSVGTWLFLDGLQLHGVPLEVDLQFAPQHLFLVARDRHGLSISLPLTLDLRRSPIEPCHVFTLTAQRSLYSILRRRSLVELLLRKLSRFFNSSNSRQLSVVSMTPGSTVVSWYNSSLCETRLKMTHCHTDHIQRMWLAMRSEDGSVDPKFRDAMLPEFPVTKVGPVSYRQDCLSTSPPPTFDSTNPAAHTTTPSSSCTNISLSPTSNICLSASTSITPTSQQIISYQWMAGILIALLVVCLLILIVLLAAAVFYFCRGRGRSRLVAIWPADRLLSAQSRDLNAIRPKRPPLFNSEPPPPPHRLWINLTQDDEKPAFDDEKGKIILDKALRPRPPYYHFSDI